MCIWTHGQFLMNLFFSLFLYYSINYPNVVQKLYKLNYSTTINKILHTYITYKKDTSWTVYHTLSPRICCMRLIFWEEGGCVSWSWFGLLSNFTGGKVILIHLLHLFSSLDTALSPWWFGSGQWNFQQNHWSQLTRFAFQKQVCLKYRKNMPVSWIWV